MRPPWAELPEMGGGGKVEILKRSATSCGLEEDASPAVLLAML